MDEVMKPEEQKTIIEWANLNYHRFKKNGTGRQYRKFRELPDVPECVYTIRERIVQREKLYGVMQEPLLTDYIGYIQDGGQIHPHIDPNRGDLIHTRFNVFVQLPQKGGMPIYNDETIQVRERTYIICYAGLHKHYCEKVEGSKARIILSYGFLK
jgi:hypothetical protein